MRISWS
jgi:hypothetical protein